MRRIVSLICGVVSCFFLFSFSYADEPVSIRPETTWLKQLFPPHIAARPMKYFRGWQIDFNGDGKKEYLIVMDPNDHEEKKTKASMCPCPPKKLKGKEKLVASWFSKQKPSIQNISLIPTSKKKHDLTFWASVRGHSLRDFRHHMIESCKILAAKEKEWRSWNIDHFVLINSLDGKKAKVRISRCQKLAKLSSKKQRWIFRKWISGVKVIPVDKCPCPKEVVAFQPQKPLSIVIAKTASSLKAESKSSPGQGKEAALKKESPSKFEVIGRYQGISARLIPLTSSQDIIGLRLEKILHATKTQPRLKTESIYIYDHGNAKRMKKIFSIEVSKEGTGQQVESRQWKTISFRNMDDDSWMEMIVDSFFESPELNGRMQRQMYKWFRGQYVLLNQYRGITKVSTSSTWKKIAPNGGPFLQKKVQMRVSPENVADGFRDTLWVGSKLKRGIGEWVQLDFDQHQSLLGVAISAQMPKQTVHIVPALFQSISNDAPVLIAPKYLQIETSSGKSTIEFDPKKSFHYVAFPKKVQTKFLKVTLVKSYLDANRKKHQLTLPKGEKSLGFLSEILPVQERARYSASSFEISGLNRFLPEYSGDRSDSTAWAEGRKDAGIGEWIEILLPSPQSISSLVVVNGCHRPGERYTLNNRVKQATFLFSNGFTHTVVLKDIHTPQTIRLPKIQTRTVKMTIKSIYKGKLGNTTCVAELRTH